MLEIVLTLTSHLFAGLAGRRGCGSRLGWSKLYGWFHQAWELGPRGFNHFGGRNRAAGAQKGGGGLEDFSVLCSTNISADDFGLYERALSVLDLGLCESGENSRGLEVYLLCSDNYGDGNARCDKHGCVVLLGCKFQGEAFTVV